MDTTAPPGGMEVGPGATGHSSGGQFGPLIGVLAVIAVMGIFAGFLGRLCSGRTVFGYGPHGDAEAWVEKKCAACLDGQIQMGCNNGQLTHRDTNGGEARGWQPENIVLRPQQQPQVVLPNHNVPMQTPPLPHPHLQRHPSKEMEVILRPLPRRQGSVGERRESGRMEAEITSDEERRKPVNGGGLEEEEEDRSDSTEHDDHHHHHRRDSHPIGHE